jgi:hypothetical protein
MWVDNWHPIGILLDKYGFRVVYDAHSSREARLSSVLSNGNWCWSPARSDSLVEIQSRLPEVLLGESDKPIWTASNSGTFVCADTWEALRSRHEMVNWWPLVWFAYAIPKQAFVLWLTMRDSLTTGARLASWGFKGDVLCLFCRHCLESRDHLFFECGFSSRIWKACLVRCLVDNPPFIWSDVVSVGCSHWKKKVLHDTLCRLVLSSTIYNIWRARNEIKHQGHPKTEDQIMKQVIWEVRTRIVGKGKFQKTRENLLLCQAWNLPNDLLG